MEIKDSNDLINLNRALLILTLFIIVNHKKVNSLIKKILNSIGIKTIDYTKDVGQYTDKKEPRVMHSKKKKATKRVGSGHPSAGAESPRLQNKRGYTPGKQEPEDRLKNKRGYTPGEQEPEDRLKNKRGFTPKASALK